MRISVWVIAAGVLGAAGCRDDSASTVDPNAPIRIAVTIKPLALLVSDIVGEAGAAHVEVTTIISSSTSPHGFEPTPDAMRALHRADVIVCNGMGLDGWASRTMSGRQVLVRFADVVGVSGDHHHDHEHGQGHHDHDDRAEDEHLWLDVDHVRVLSSHLAAVLTQVAGERSYSTEFAQSIDESLSSLHERLDEVDATYQRTLDTHRNSPIVTFHSVLGRIADRYGLTVAAVLRPIESLEPAPDDVRRAVDAIATRRIAAIFVEPQFSTAAAERIAEETGIRLVILDPLGSSASSWPEFMLDLLASIRSGLEPADDGA